jgi:hypothetical protein
MTLGLGSTATHTQGVKRMSLEAPAIRRGSLRVQVSI